MINLGKTNADSRRLRERENPCIHRLDRDEEEAIHLGPEALIIYKLAEPPV